MSEAGTPIDADRISIVAKLITALSLLVAGAACLVVSIRSGFALPAAISFAIGSGASFAAIRSSGRARCPTCAAVMCGIPRDGESPCSSCGDVAASRDGRLYATAAGYDLPPESETRRELRHVARSRRSIASLTAH